MSDSTYAWACACMGPVYGEPLCPCDMKRRGLPSSPEHIAANEKANREFAELVKSGVFSKKEKEPTS